MRNGTVGRLVHQNRKQRRKSRAGEDHRPKFGHLGYYVQQVLTAQYCFSSTGIVENMSFELASHWGEISYLGWGLGVGGRPLSTLNIPSVTQMHILWSSSKSDKRPWGWVQHQQLVKASQARGVFGVFFPCSCGGGVQYHFSISLPLPQDSQIAIVCFYTFAKVFVGA